MAVVVTPLRQYPGKCETRQGPPSLGDTFVQRKPQRRNYEERQRVAELSSMEQASECHTDGAVLRIDEPGLKGRRGRELPARGFMQ